MILLGMDAIEIKEVIKTYFSRRGSSTVVDKLSLKQMEDDLKGTLKAEKISYGNAGGMKTEIFGIGVSVVK